MAGALVRLLGPPADVRGERVLGASVPCLEEEGELFQQPVERFVALGLTRKYLIGKRKIVILPKGMEEGFLTFGNLNLSKVCLWKCKRRKMKESWRVTKIWNGQMLLSTENGQFNHVTSCLVVIVSVRVI